MNKDQYEPITNIPDFITALWEGTLSFEKSELVESYHLNRVSIPNLEEDIAYGRFSRKVEPETVDWPEYISRDGEVVAGEELMGEPTGYKIIGQRVKA